MGNVRLEVYSRESRKMFHFYIMEKGDRYFVVMYKNNLHRKLKRRTSNVVAVIAQALGA